MNNAYAGREQTEAKHFILKHYLEQLALIAFQSGYYRTLTYIDGFSGPWKSQTADYSDTSFMIAIEVLKAVQGRLAQKGTRPVVRCFFVEKDKETFAELDATVRQHHDPTTAFLVETFNGRFEDAVAAIMQYADGFSLTFIDPTGWTEYAFDRIQPVLARTPGEVLINFMYDHISRFASWDNPNCIASFNGILRAGWTERIDESLPPGQAALQLFRAELKEAGNFKHVISTPIKKLQDRIHFCITYGTRHPKGVSVYRNVEFKALRAHDFRRFEAQIAKAIDPGQRLLFTPADLHQTRTLDTQTNDEKDAAAVWVVEILRTRGPLFFRDIWPEMLELYALRKTDAKDVLVGMSERGTIQNTWRVPGSRRRKPDDDDCIQLAVS